ncbi:MAG: HNH endonuclease [Caldilineaceae bacterium]|nr:HNH endonuclease [Caldilineaceae bacterium]
MPEQRVTAEQKRAVLERARGCCEYCKSQARFATQSFSTEHIIPRHLVSRQGSNDGIEEFASSDANGGHLRMPDSVFHQFIVDGTLGGETALDNLALACQGCNNHKYTKTEAQDPVSDKVVPLYHPRQQRWHDHLAWNDGFILVVGLTPTGRATIKALQLNRVELINLRRILYAMGEHPPGDNLG